MFRNLLEWGTRPALPPIPPSFLHAMMRTRRQRYKQPSLYIYLLGDIPGAPFGAGRNGFENWREPIPGKHTEMRPTLPKDFRKLPIRQAVRASPVQWSIRGELFQPQRVTYIRDIFWKVYRRFNCQDSKNCKSIFCGFSPACYWFH